MVFVPPTTLPEPALPEAGPQLLNELEGGPVDARVEERGPVVFRRADAASRLEAPPHLGRVEIAAHEGLVVGRDEAPEVGEAEAEAP